MADTPQSSSADEINVKVKTMQPATYELRIPLTATVGNLKQLLVDKASIPQDRQRIIYKGRVLDNDQQLQAHGVQEGHTLHLVERALTAPSPAAGQAPQLPGQLPGQGQIPIAVGSLDFDTEETDVNALLSSIFTQFGGQGGMPGFAAGEGENAAGANMDHQGGQEAQFIAQQLMSTLQGQAGQDFGIQAFGGMPGERRPNMLASIQTYLDKLQEIMQNPSVLLPSLSYPPGQEHELSEQRQLVEAVRGILTPAVCSALSPEQQAFLNAEASWQPPAPATGSSNRQNSATQRQGGAAQAAAHAQQNDPAAQQAAEAQPFGSPVQPQSESAQRESSTSAARSEDSSRRRRRRAAISPVVTMALGSLLQTTLEGDAFQDPANVLSNAAQLLLSTHSFDGDNRAQVLANLRSAGSHLYRLAPLLMELARACSAAVAAMQGDAGPLALSSAHYIRPDGSRPAIGYTPASGQQFMTSNMSIPLFPGMPLGAMHLGPDGVRPTMAGPAPAANGPTNAAGNRGGAASSAAPRAASGAGAGADANRAGQAIGLNIGTLLQSAFAGAGGGSGGGGGGEPNRPGVSIGESRQVIQVPGAPPVTIRFGTRPPGPHPPGSHPPPLGQQGPVNSPVSLQALPDPASASAAGPASGVTRPGSQRAVGLGSAALPPRDKGSKKSHPRSPTPGSTSPSADQSTSSRQSPGSRLAPSQPQQDNVKRARRGSSPPSEGLSQSPATAVGGSPNGAEPGAAVSRGEAVEQIAQPNRGAVQASSAGGLDALMAGMFGGGGGSGGGGGLNMNSLLQVAGQMMSDPEVSRGVTGMIETLGQRAGGTRADQSEQSPQAGGGGADAGGGFGAIMQSLGPMMQQLAVGAGQSQGTGTQQVAGSAGGVSSSSSNWQEALSDLDEGEKAEWECIIREDLEKQAELAPERYKDHSTAYVAGKPPAAASTLLPGGPAGSHAEDSD
ncbi:hypothetical protein WJX82_001722 [Trebouxia sp. C0006]